MEKSVLIAGRVDFWRDALTRRFLKEGWEIFRLGEAEPEEAPPEFGDKVHFFAYEKGDIDVFSTYTPALVIYLCEVSPGEDNYARLQSVLSLANRFKANHFYFLSSAEVFAPPDSVNSVPLHKEEETPAPGTQRGWEIYQAEECVRAWRRTRDLKTSIFRFTSVYDTTEGEGESWLAEYLSPMVAGKTVTLSGIGGKRDFLALQDAAFAVYQAATRGFDGEVLHVAQGEAVVGEALHQLSAPIRSDVHGGETVSLSYPEALLDASLARSELGWQPRGNITADLANAYQGMKDTMAAALEKKERTEAAEKKRRFKKNVVPYIENGAGFLLMLLAGIFQGLTTVNQVNYFDLNYLYIGTMGLLYGKRQSLIACGLACVLLIGFLCYQGMNPVAILYVPKHLLHLTSYLLAAILTGYFADLRSHEKEAWNWQEKQYSDRYAFLRRMYNENTSVKDKLYREIINMDDSIGRLYRIIRRLDSIETERVFTQAAAVTAEILDVPDVAIYVMSRDRHFLRQRVRLGKGLEDLPRSQRVEDHAYIRSLVENKTVYVNFDLDKSAPDLAAPIIYQGEVIAVLEIFGMDFAQWSLQQQNLLSITSRLISSSLGRAYQYENDTQAKKYYGNTRLLLDEEFYRILDALQARKSLQGSLPLALLRLIIPEGMSYEEVDEKISHAIRLEDFVGFMGGEIYILLPDVTEDVVNMVLLRLKNNGIAAEVREAVA
ncbi:MAG: NAD-dependent epimerase/dehydratase family protein [Selenomonadaceae bacterium]|nr:NAD-dependent epimerase/dehydratase family protein [Selenomonadaceae bacterium]